MENDDLDDEFEGDGLEDMMKELSEHLPLFPIPINMLAWIEKDDCYVSIGSGVMYKRDLIKPFKYRFKVEKHIFLGTTDGPVFLVGNAPDALQEYCLATDDFPISEATFKAMKGPHADEPEDGEEWKGTTSATGGRIFPRQWKFKKEIDTLINYKIEDAHLFMRDKKDRSKWSKVI